jgi:hypothetical protein
MAIQLLTTFWIIGTQNTMVVVAANKKTAKLIMGYKIVHLIKMYSKINV